MEFLDSWFHVFGNRPHNTPDFFIGDNNPDKFIIVRVIDVLIPDDTPRPVGGI